ncbi:MAG: hypothetical protein KF852_02765 [Saprospiraceae bacterium]|nr:hypothetical protein [Saprospiraceae bacterium]
MNNRHPIDEYFRKALEEYGVEPPPMHVWKRIEENRRRAAAVPVAAPAQFSWLLIAAGAFLLLFAPRSEFRHASQPEVSVVAAAPARVAPSQQAASAPSEKNRTVEKEQLSAVANAAAILPAAYRSQPATNPVITTDALSDLEHIASAQNTAGHSPAIADERGMGASERPAVAATASSTMHVPMFLAPLSPNETQLLNRSFPETSRCASFKDMWIRFHLDLLASPDLASRQIHARNEDPETEAYAQLRDQSEQPHYQFSAGARISATTNFGLAMRTGVNYSQLNERFRYLTQTEERFTIINILGPGGAVIGVDTVYETIHREHVVHNSYRSIDIPVLLGYEFPFRRWTVSVNGGAYINLLFRQRGSFFVPGSDNPVSFSVAEAENTEVFRNRLGVGWYAGAGLAYKIRHNLQIIAEPHLRAFPRSFTADGFDVNQRYTQGGLSLGVRYKI